MDPGDIDVNPRQSAIWTAVYLVQSEGVPSVEMLFTVAINQQAAEESFIAELEKKFERVSDLAPEQIAQLPRTDEGSVADGVSRLFTLGYRFALPVREQIPDEHVSKLVHTLLSFDEIDRDE